jgi:hypothetical protein
MYAGFLTGHISLRDLRTKRQKNPLMAEIVRQELDYKRHERKDKVEWSRDRSKET